MRAAHLTSSGGMLGTENGATHNYRNEKRQTYKISIVKFINKYNTAEIKYIKYNMELNMKV